MEEARKSPHGVADWDNDEYLDGALNQEDYGGGSYDEWGKSFNPSLAVLVCHQCQLNSPNHWGQEELLMNSLS